MILVEKALTAAGLDKSHDDIKKVGEEMEAKMKALLEAFKGEKFDIAQVLNRDLEAERALLEAHGTPEQDAGSR